MRAGGDDFDSALMEWLAEEHLQGVDWRAPRFLASLRALAEAAKVRGAMPAHQRYHTVSHGITCVGMRVSSVAWTQASSSNVALLSLGLSSSATPGG